MSRTIQTRTQACSAERDQALNALTSTRRPLPSAADFQSFSARGPLPSASAHIVELPEDAPPDDEGPPPPGDDDPGDDPGNEDDYGEGPHTPVRSPPATPLPPDVLLLGNLVTAIEGLASRTQDSSSRAKCREPDTFDGSDSKKLPEFLVQCELNFQNRPNSFRSNRAKVAFAQSYLKGAALAWFEPDLLNSDNPDLRPLWMDDYKEFIVKLQTNFGPPDPVGDAEHQLDHLSMKDHHRVNKYLVEFNRYASQVKGYGEGALRHMFYNGLPDRIKDEVSRVGKPRTLFELRTLAQTIDACYWECKTECARQEKSARNSSNKSKQSSSSGNTSTSATSNSASKGKDKDKDKSSQKSSAKSSSASAPDLSNVLGKDGKLTPAERSRRISNSLCLFCGDAGHNAKDCPKSASRAAKARAAQATTPTTSSEKSAEAKK